MKVGIFCCEGGALKAFCWGGNFWEPANLGEFCSPANLGIHPISCWPPFFPESGREGFFQKKRCH